MIVISFAIHVKSQDVITICLKILSGALNVIKERYLISLHKLTGYLFTGRCVHTRTRIYKGDRFLKYGGILCYEEPEGDDTYIFEFKWKGKTYW